MISTSINHSMSGCGLLSSAYRHFCAVHANIVMPLVASGLSTLPTTLHDIVLAYLLPLMISFIQRALPNLDASDPEYVGWDIFRCHQQAAIRHVEHNHETPFILLANISVLDDLPTLAQSLQVFGRRDTCRLDVRLARRLRSRFANASYKFTDA